MKLLVISSPGQVNDEANIINQLFKSGLQYFHIRKPTDSVEQVRALISGIDPGYYSCLSIHQHHGLAEEFKINRLHFTESERKKLNRNTITRLIDRGFNLSTSIHDLALLPFLENYKYVFFGPVYDSISKPDYKSELHTGFKINKVSQTPLIIGIGGIWVDKLDDIKNMNFDLMAPQFWEVSGKIRKTPWPILKQYSNA
jgi:thiamine-phosphate pyrophosphorylase